MGKGGLRFFSVVKNMLWLALAWQSCCWAKAERWNPVGFTGCEVVYVPDEDAMPGNPRPPKFKTFDSLRLGDYILCLKDRNSKPSWGIVTSIQVCNGEGLRFGSLGYKEAFSDAVFNLNYIGKQKFYSPSFSDYILLDDAPRRCLFSYPSVSSNSLRPAASMAVSVEKRFPCNEKIYSISVYPHGNYFVGKHGILVHNVNLAFFAAIAAGEVLVPLISEAAAVVVASQGANLAPVAVSSLSFLKVAAGEAIKEKEVELSLEASASQLVSTVVTKKVASGSSLLSIKDSVASAVKTHPNVSLAVFTASAFYGLYRVAKKYWIDDIDRLLEFRVLQPSIFPENNSTDLADVYKSEWERCQAAERRTLVAEPVSPFPMPGAEIICTTPQADDFPDFYLEEDQESEVSSSEESLDEEVVSEGGGGGKKPPEDDEESRKKRHLRKKQKSLDDAKRKAVKTKELPDGRVRYYEREKPSRTEGKTRGASYVTEHNPKTGDVRSWMECYDQDGNVNRVHPKRVNGTKVVIPHYPPTKSDLEMFYGGLGE